MLPQQSPETKDIRPQPDNRKRSCKYCLEGVEVRFIAKRNVFHCPVCDTYYANNAESNSQLLQAGKKHLKKLQEFPSPQ